VNTYKAWVIMQGIGSPPSYRADRMENSPWLESKQAVIDWIDQNERLERAATEPNSGISRVPEAERYPNR